MVDKIWYEWQKDPRNKYAYGGGSVAPLANYTVFTEFPTGLPPYLGVSILDQIPNTPDVIMTFWFDFPQFDSEIPGDGLWDGVQIWDVMDTTGGTLCYVYA